MNIKVNKLVKGSFIHSARTLSLTKSMSWITRMYNANKLGINGIRAGRFNRVLEFYENIISAFDNYYGNDWDMHMYKDEDYYHLVPMVVYKKVVITNEKEQNKEIKNLYVVFNIYYNDVLEPYISGLRGTRSSFSPEDYHSKYVHSHLPTSRMDSFSRCFITADFCLGGGEVNDFISQMHEQNMDMALLEFFFVFLETFVSWESIEGVPHIHMDVTLDNFNREKVIVEDTRLQGYFKTFKRILNGHPEISTDLNFTYDINKHRIKNDERFDKFLLSVIKLTTTLSWLVCRYDKVNNEYYTVRRESSLSTLDIDIVRGSQSGEIPYTIIQGKRIYQEFLPTTLIPDKEETFTIHPKFRKYAKQELEKSLYKASIRRSEIALQAKNSRIEQFIEQDQVSVQANP